MPAWWPLAVVADPQRWGPSPGAGRSDGTGLVIVRARQRLPGSVRCSVRGRGDRRGPLGPGKAAVIEQKSKIEGDGSSRSAVSESSVEHARDRLAGLLPDDALQDALEGLEPEEITAPGGLLTQLAGRVIETALGAELNEHLGYRPGQAPPGGAGSYRDGHAAKTVATELGPVAVRTPRDRKGSFEPKLVGKRQTRLAGLEGKILDLYAGGMTVRDIAGHLQDLYGVQIARDTISRVTDAVLEDVAAWRTRPLDQVHPIVYFDCLIVKVREDRSVRNRPCYLAVGVSVDGERDVLNDLAQRGVQDVPVACVDGLAGFPEAIEAIFPAAWVQPASCTRSAARCATSPTRTARPSPAISSPSTAPSTPTRPTPRCRSSTSAGASATR